jgi:hypothetical protein
LERVGHLREDLTWLLPELGPPPATNNEDLALARGRLIEAVLQLLANAGRGEPLLILIDEAHKLSEGALALLRAVLDRPWERAVILVVACRSDAAEWPSGDGEPLLDLLKREKTITMEVDRLRTADLSDLVDRVDLAVPGLEQVELVSRLGAQTGGIPLLVRELLKLWTADTVLAATPVESKGGPISPLIEAVIGQRLDGLPGATKRLVETAAVIGMQFDLNAVAHACGVATVDMLDQLDEALRAGVIVETGQLDCFAFDHGLIRDVLSARVSISRKVRIHCAATDYFAAHGSLIDAALHALPAVEELGTAGTVEVTVQGADAALASLQFELARTLCDEVVNSLGASLPLASRVDLLIRIGQAEALAGHIEAAEEAWRAGADIARTIGDHERFTRVALATELLSRNIDASDLRWDLLTEAMQRAEPEWTRLRLLIASQWLNEAATPAHHAATPELVAEIVDQARRLDDLSVLVAACGARNAWSRLGHDPRRLEWSQEYLEVAQELGEDEWLFRAHLACLIDSIVDADGASADRFLGLVTEAGHKLRAPRDLWFRELAMATCARLRGDFEIADEHITLLSTLGEQFGISDTAAVGGAVTFTNAYHFGELARLRPSLEPFAAAYPSVPAWTLGSGLAALSDGDPAAAKESLRRGVSLLSDRAADGLWLAGVCLAVEIAVRLPTDSETLDRLLEILEPYVGKYAIVGTLSTEFGPVDRCLGLLQLARGNQVDASTYFASAVSVCQSLRARPWELLTRADWRAAEQIAGAPSRDWWSRLPNDQRKLPPPHVHARP